MKTACILVAVAIAATACGNPDYILDVFVGRNGTNTTYYVAGNAVSLQAITKEAEQVPRRFKRLGLAAHIVARESTTMKDILRAAQAVRLGGMTNIVVSVFLDLPSRFPDGKRRGFMTLKLSEMSDSEGWNWTQQINASNEAAQAIGAGAPQPER